MHDTTQTIRLLLKSNCHLSFINSSALCIYFINFFIHFFFIIITSLNISVIRIHFLDAFFYFAYFINKLTYLKKYGKSIYFGITICLLNRLLFLFLFLVFLFLFFLFFLVLLVFLICRFSSFFGFSIFSSSRFSRFSISISSLSGFDIFIC